MDKLDKNNLTSLEQKGAIGIIAVLILLAGIVAGVYLVQKTQIFKPKASAETVSLLLQPTEASAIPNQQTTLSVFANANNFSITAAELHISYDPILLENVDIQAESVLPVVLAERSYRDLSDGRREIMITVGANPQGVFKGSGTIATLSITPTANFNSLTTIDLTSDTKVTMLEREGYGDRTLSNATLTVLASPTPTPSSILSTPTPQPTPDTTITCTCGHPGGSTPNNDFICKNAGGEVVESRHCAWWEHCTTSSVRPAWPCENN